ncbi:hypothetical protein ABTC50_20560, partial [Acinetobacter baumannii]
MAMTRGRDALAREHVEDEEGSQAVPQVDAAGRDCHLSGAIKWFDLTRGFGFMVADQPGYGDVLIHFSV